jgi:glycerol-3-phosphate dehydrogenase
LIVEEPMPPAVDQVFDLAIVGGGINGAGIAADASQRGLSVYLAEKGDLAGATSSASSKLIHGGLRYLEHFEFRLVREALHEREVLLQIAPHIVWPLRFVLPHVPSMRNAGLIQAGLFLYDHLAKRHRIPASSAIDLASDPAGRALKPSFERGFSYWDCWVDDARLVILNARAAHAEGAHIETLAEVSDVSMSHDLWHLTIGQAGKRQTIRARVLVNAAGPWAEGVARMIARALPSHNSQPPHISRARLVKGSHIVVPRISDSDAAYLLQSGEGRVVFALPFEETYTIIGTTDVPYTGDPATVAIDDSEQAYLLDLANQFFATPLTAQDIVWRYSGVRPLFDDGSVSASAVTRDYKLELIGGTAGAPAALTVLGGKITTYRKLAEAALHRLTPYLPAMAPCRTQSTPLPGGAESAEALDAYEFDVAVRRPGFSETEIATYVRRYGTLTDEVLGEAKSARDLGAALGAGLSEREVLYLRKFEWAKTADDVLWRRTKAGLHMSREQLQRAQDQIASLL